MSNKTGSLFEKKNLTWMLLGLALIALGMFLMSGGQSNTDPAVFNRAEVYSSTRITVAPLLILAGLIVEVIAIFKK
jgi:hypothetical protein